MFEKIQSKVRQLSTMYYNNLGFFIFFFRFFHSHNLSFLQKPIILNRTNKHRTHLFIYIYINQRVLFYDSYLFFKQTRDGGNEFLEINKSKHFILIIQLYLNNYKIGNRKTRK